MFSAMDFNKLNENPTNFATLAGLNLTYAEDMDKYFKATKYDGERRIL